MTAAACCKRLGTLPAPRRDPALRVLPAHVPQRQLRRRPVRNVAGGLVTRAIPLLGLLRVARLEIDAAERVGGCGGPSRILGLHLRVERAAVVPRGIFGPRLEGERRSHRRERLVLRAIRRERDRALEVIACFGVATRQIERLAQRVLRLVPLRIRRRRRREIFRALRRGSSRRAVSVRPGQEPPRRRFARTAQRCRWPSASRGQQ